MNASLFSPLWYRVADQHPHLRPEVRVQRQQIRDRRWYLLVNAANGRQFRANQQAYELIGRCDGHRSVQQVWDDLLKELGDDAPTQDEVIQTLNELDQQDLLSYESAPDAQALVRRREERTQGQRFVNPFALRIPLGDPSAALRGLGRLPRLVFSSLVLWIWVAVVGAAALVAAFEWNTLAHHAAAYMGTPRYLLLACICFPIIKALHELGHLLAVRRWGGEVHEVGFSLFVLVPAPYVDASAAAAFPARYQRVIVGAAGMMVELIVAAAALVVWLNVQPGLVGDLAFVTMFIAGVSTLLFNGNPLLRFDAYYILCDVLDLPNVDSHSKAWWMNAALRACGARPSRMQLADGERKWLIVYAPASFAYRVLISGVLVLWVASHSTLLAAGAALLLAATVVVKPAASSFARLWAGAAAQNARTHAGIVAAAAAGFLAVSAFVVPLPFHTVAGAVVWPPEHARVRPATDGFIAEMLARDGERVAAGQVLMVLDDPALIAERAALTSRLEQLHAGRYTELLTSSEQTRNIEEQIARVQSELARAQQKIAHLEVRASTPGTLVMPHQQDLARTFVRKGSTVAYVLERDDIRVRAAVPEYDAMLVRDGTRSVTVWLAGGRESVTAELMGDIPAATFDLPSAALGDRGGGSLATDPADKDGLRARQPVVLVEVKLPATHLERVGGTATVRFDHGAQPLAQRWYRQLRQVLLHHVNQGA